MSYQSLLILLKTLLILLASTAIITQIVSEIQQAAFDPTKFFGYFTIQTNLIAIAALVFGVYYLVRRRHEQKIAELRTAATVYVVVVGVGFAVLLQGGAAGDGPQVVPWVDTVLHHVMPVAIALDFLFDRPRLKMPLLRKLLWLLYPVVYVACCLVRGFLTGWYPYPFVNPTVSSASQIAITVGGLMVLGTILIVVTHWFQAKAVTRKA